MIKVIYISCILGFLLSSCEDNAGQWTELDIGFNDDFHDIAPIDKNTLIAYSYGSGIFIRSTDGGQSWKQVYQTDSIYFEQIEFPTPNVGYICGNTNKILKSENGGENWNEIVIDSIPKDSPIYGMKFTNSQIGYISVMQRSKNGFESKILQTTDGGEKWTEINSIPSMILNIEFINNEYWGSGQNVLIRNIDKSNWKIEYQDTTNQVGQIRDLIVEDGKIIMSSFNGFIIVKDKDIITKQQITKNRLRSIVQLKNGELIAAGDNNKELGNFFESKDGGLTWMKNEKELHDIHRLKVKDDYVFCIGKKDQLLKIKM